MDSEKLLKEISSFELTPSVFLDDHMVRCLHDDTDGKTIGNLILSFPHDIQCLIWADSSRNMHDSSLRFRTHDGGGRCLRTHRALRFLMHIVYKDLKRKKRHKSTKRTETNLTTKKLSNFLRGHDCLDVPFERVVSFEGFNMYISNDGDMRVSLENWGSGFNCWDNQLLSNAFVILGYAMQEDTKWGRRFL